MKNEHVEYVHTAGYYSMGDKQLLHESRLNSGIVEVL